MTDRPNFGDWLEQKVGTRLWCVAPRLGSRMAERYELAISQKRYKALQAEYEAVYGPVYS